LDRRSCVGISPNQIWKMTLRQRKKIETKLINL
jgi:hypothetical protein